MYDNTLTVVELHVPLKFPLMEMVKILLYYLGILQVENCQGDGWSSAINRIFDLVLSGRSLIYIKIVLGLGPNHKGPQMSQALFQTLHFPEKQ